jgi:hypothetical protein
MPHLFKKIALTLFIFNGLIFMVQAQNESGGNSKKVKPELSGWQSYKNEVRKLSVQYPSDWKLSENENNTVFLAISPRTSEQDFMENVNLMIQNLGGLNIDLEKYTDISTNQVETMLPEGKVLSIKDITFKNMPAKELIYSGKYNGVIDLKWKQIYFIKGSEAYVLTYTAALEAYETYLANAEKIFNSLIMN